MKDSPQTPLYYPTQSIDESWKAEAQQGEKALIILQYIFQRRSMAESKKLGWIIEHENGHNRLSELEKN